MAPKAYISWSSGKDSAFALIEARRLGLAEVVGVLTTLTEEYDRVAMHGVRHSLLDRQIAALGLPAIKVMIPSPCPNEVYESRMAGPAPRSRRKVWITSYSAICSWPTSAPIAKKKWRRWA